jgi:hypothetical protein
MIQCSFQQSEAERLRKTRETTAEEIGRLKLAEEELVQVFTSLLFAVGL